MRKMIIHLLTLIAAAAAGGVGAQEQMLKISMQILSDSKLLATPTMVVKNGKPASVSIGREIATSTASPGPSSTLIKVDLLPTVGTDDMVNVAINVATTDEKMVDDQPLKSTRTLELALKLHLGKQGSVSIPSATGQQALAFSIQIDAVGDAELVAMREKKPQKLNHFYRRVFSDNYVW